MVFSSFFTFGLPFYSPPTFSLSNFSLRHFFLLASSVVRCTLRIQSSFVMIWLERLVFWFRESGNNWIAVVKDTKNTWHHSNFHSDSPRATKLVPVQRLNRQTRGRKARHFNLPLPLSTFPPPLVSPTPIPSLTSTSTLVLVSVSSINPPWTGSQVIFRPSIFTQIEPNVLLLSASWLHHKKWFLTPVRNKMLVKVPTWMKIALLTSIPLFLNLYNSRAIQSTSKPLLLMLGEKIAPLHLTKQPFFLLVLPPPHHPPPPLLLLRPLLLPHLLLLPLLATLSLMVNLLTLRLVLEN